MKKKSDEYAVGKEFNMCKKAIQEIKSKYSECSDMPKAANFLLGELKNSSIPIQIVKIVQEAGFTVFCQNFSDPHLSGIIAIDNELKSSKYKTSMLISINNQDNIGHKRFTVAHEFAHYIFDFDESKHITYYNTYYTSDEAASEETEKRANCFAANLLMPEDMFKKEFKKHVVECNLYETTCALAEIFQVSAKAINKRIDELQLKV